MSRSGYTDECSEWDLIRWRGAVNSALKGKRGQAFLREMLAALEAMQYKELIQSELVTPDGDVCAMGVVCKARGLDVSDIDPDDYSSVSGKLGLADAMVREIAEENDYFRHAETPEQRWVRMHKWVKSQIIEKKSNERKLEDMRAPYDL